MNDKSVIPQAVRNLQAATAEYDGAKEALSKRRTAFQESIETETAHVLVLASEVENLKNEVGPLALAEFKATSEKKMWGGIGIREKSVVSYDAAKALAFAKEKDMFLKLDAATFEKAAPALGLEFVKIEKVPSVTYPKEWKS